MGSIWGCLLFKGRTFSAAGWFTGTGNRTRSSVFSFVVAHLRDLKHHALTSADTFVEWRWTPLPNGNVKKRDAFKRDSPSPKAVSRSAAAWNAGNLRPAHCACPLGGSHRARLLRCKWRQIGSGFSPKPSGHRTLNILLHSTLQFKVLLQAVPSPCQENSYWHSTVLHWVPCAWVFKGCEELRYENKGDCLKIQGMFVWVLQSNRLLCVISLPHRCALTCAISSSFKVVFPLWRSCSCLFLHLSQDKSICLPEGSGCTICVDPDLPCTDIFERCYL